MIGTENAKEFLRDFSSDMDSEDMETFVGYGFETSWKFGGHTRFHDPPVRRFGIAVN